MKLMRTKLENLANYIWYQKGYFSWCLLPLSWIVEWEVKRRQQSAPAKGSTPDDTLVVVVGGVTVGGTGKTPVLMSLAKFFLDLGYRVGVISRGYRGSYQKSPHMVEPEDPHCLSGDEPLLVRRSLNIPVVVFADRRKALQHLIAHNNLDIVLSDDGLQHYNLPRDIEIAVLDFHRGLGNRRLLPAGPLREPADRLDQVDWVLERNSPDEHRGFFYQLNGFRNLVSGERLDPAQAQVQWKEIPAVAIAGIGQPEQFFDMLRARGFRVTSFPLPDHYKITESEIQSIDVCLILCTQKDAIKLQDLVDLRVWVVEIEAQLPESFLRSLSAELPAPRQIRD